ncbi:MAG: TrmH family RNA methyltransferase [Aestuariivirgaceae bacterium]
MEEITSAQNPVIKLVRSLSSRKHRESLGLFAVEGPEYALKAKAHGYEPHLLLVDRAQRAGRGVGEILAWARKERARTVAVPPALMFRLSGLNNPQPLILLCRQRFAKSFEGNLPADALVLALDRIRDPGNLGTIMRTAEASGVTRLCLIADTCDPYSPEALRASAGSLFAMDVLRCSHDEALAMMASWPGDTIATERVAGEDFRQRYLRPALLLMGSESEGLHIALRDGASKRVRIPMAPGVESLNLATATALMLYELQLPRISERHGLT